MSARSYVPAEDLSYGPGNPDYEYDDARQRELDDAAEAHHQQELLRQQQEEKHQ